MIKIVAIFLLLIYSVIGSAQEINNQDSALYYYQRSAFRKAIEWGKKHVAAMKEARGLNDTVYGSALNNLGIYYYSNGDIKESIDPYIKAAEIFRINYGASHPLYLFIIHNIGIAQQKLGSYKDAEHYLKLAVEGKQKSNDTINADYPNYLNSLGSFYSETEKYELAEEIFKRVLKIYDSGMVERNKNLAKTINNLAVLYYRLSRLKESEHFFKEALLVTEEIYGRDHWEHANIINNISAIQIQLGNYDAAAKALSSCSQSVKRQLGELHPLYTTMLNNLGAALFKNNQMLEAKKYFLEYKQNAEARFGKMNHNYATAINNLGYLSFLILDNETASKYFTEVLEIYKKLYGEESLKYAIALNSIALIASRKGAYDRVDALLSKSLETLKKAGGDKHAEYLTGQVILFDALCKANRPDRGIAVSSDLLRKEIDLLKTRMYYLSVEEQLLYILSRQSYFSPPFAALYFKKDTMLIEQAIDGQLFLKGAIIENNSRLYPNSELIKDTLISSKWKAYQKSKRDQIKYITILPMPEISAIDSLTRHAKDLEKELLTISASYRGIDERINISWRKVRQKLNNKDAAIEFVRFQYINTKNYYVVQYGAFLLSNQYEKPLFISLCSEDDLRASLLRFPYKSSAFMSKSVQLKKTTATPYDLIWKPLEKYLSGVTTIYFSPDGLLHQIPMAALPINQRQLMIDKYELIQLISTRQLAIKDSSSSLPSSALFFGGINYNQQQPDISVKPHADAYSFVYQQNSRGLIDSFGYLKGAHQEVVAAEQKLKSKGVKVTTFTGSSAAESAFRSFTDRSQPTVIHFATHGFTLPDTSFKTGVNPVFTTSKNPLLRTGLVMAGGNIGWKARNKYDEDDGILTGMEIAAMQLPNTQLVILSACETANGEIKGSEGVFGLQRAFKLAGVNYVMGSLWKIPDTATRLFMDFFYTHWMAGNSIRTAFNRAQRDMRKSLGPYYWAAFVLIQ
jgi:CHAT domain-containing protein